MRTGRPKQTEATVWAAGGIQSLLQENVTCAPQAGGDGSGALGLCGTTRSELKGPHRWQAPASLPWARVRWAPWQEQFVNLTELMNFKSLKFTQKQVEAYTRVRETLRVRLAQLFGLDAEQLQHDMTFFSHINGSKTAQTVHDDACMVPCRATSHGC
eukprot:g6799.t3